MNIVYFDITIIFAILLGKKKLGTLQSLIVEIMKIEWNGREITIIMDAL